MDSPPNRSVPPAQLTSLSWVEGLARKWARVLFIVVNNGYCIPTYTIWMVLLRPCKSFSIELYYKIEGLLFHWLLAMVSMWGWSAGYSVVEIGDDIDSCLSDRALVLANHQSTADVPLLMATFNAKKAVLPNIMWIMDRIFKFTNFGIVSVLHEDFFIVSGKDRREQSLKDLAKHLHDSYIPRHRKWIVLFPEGGFLRKRRETSQRYAQKFDLPVLEHVSLPRVGAMRVIMENVGYSKAPPAPASSHIDDQLKVEKDVVNSDKLRWVIDITIAYPKGEPLDLPTLVTGSRPPCQTFLFYRRYSLSEIPEGEEEMKQWLFDRFYEKEKMLEKFYSTGELPGKEWFRNWVPPHEVSQDALRFLILHIFFITSTCVHYFFVSSIITYIWEHLAWCSLI